MATTADIPEAKSHIEPDSNTIAVGLRRLFLLHAVVQVGLGLPLLVVPDTWASLVNWGVPFDPVMGRVAGVLFLGLAVGQALAFRAETWNQVRPLFATVLTEVVLLLVVLFFAAFAGGSLSDWGFVALTGAFAASFLYYARYLFALDA